MIDDTPPLPKERDQKDGFLVAVVIAAIVALLGVGYALSTAWQTDSKIEELSRRVDLIQTTIAGIDARVASQFGDLQYEVDRGLAQYKLQVKELQTSSQDKLDTANKLLTDILKKLESVR